MLATADALLGADALNFFDLDFQLRNSVADHSAVGFELCFTRTASTNTGTASCATTSLARK
jgi:hypothetical protein